MDRKTAKHEGERMRERLFGTESDRTADPAPGFRDLMSETMYGAVWSRPGLALRDRMLCTLAALGAVQRLRELRRYLGAALHVGLEPRAIQEILLQIGIYAGFPASEEALEVARGVFADRGIALPAGAARDDALDELTLRGRRLLHELQGDRGPRATPLRTIR
jgi:4-carboxymuconolactone decarboxylase